MNEVKPFQAFMAHLPASDSDEILEILQEYDIGSYLIGYENEPYEHTHFLVQMTTQSYHNFSNTIFKKRYNLRGQARNGLPRQYAKLKKIEDLSKMASYTIKSGNIKTNMPQDEVDKYFANSFKKEEKKKLYQEVHEYLETTYTKKINLIYEVMEHTKEHIDIKWRIIRKIKLNIINYLRTRCDINMCRSNVNSYTQYHIKHTVHYQDYDKDELIYQLLF